MPLEYVFFHFRIRMKRFFISHKTYDKENINNFLVFSTL